VPPSPFSLLPPSACPHFLAYPLPSPPPFLSFVRSGVKAEDKAALERIIDSAKANFVDNKDSQRKWGGGLMGLKTNARLAKRAKFMAIEAAKRAAL
jgi:hypothetical protein